MLLNALTKVIYAVMREKYGLDYGAAANKKNVAAAKKALKKGGGKKQQPKRRGNSDYDSDESAFEASDRDYCSDDSVF